MAKIQCQKCGHREEVNAKFFLKIIGASTVGFGGYAWIRYLFAGTGLARPICIAISAGGVVMLAFSDEITKWISGNYSCPKSHSRKWDLMN